jgi:hypothetical protein
MMDDAPARALGRYVPRAATGPKPLALPAPTPATTGALTAAPRFKQLTAAEMAAKHARGECYNCTEKFLPAHMKVCIVKGVFLIQMDDEPATDQLDDLSPLISLNAITGISVVETMCLAVQIDTATLTALVDSGSTHLFLSVEAVSRLHVLPIHRQGLRVTVANDDQVASDEVCKVVRFVIDIEEFVLDFYVIPLVGFDMVLGMY